MNISVFGLGYVGCVTAAALAARGHTVVGVDTNPSKVSALRRGQAPVLEPGLPELTREVVEAGRLTATDDAGDAVARSELSLVCVGTPSTAAGGLNTDGLERVSESIGVALRRNPGRHTVVVRSTSLPGTAEKLVIPTLERASGLRAGADFGVAVNPEFLREGSSLADFGAPPKTVIGELDEPSGAVVAELYQHLDAPLFRTPLAVAEMVKYVDNAFHALKIGFANEIGALCKTSGLDSHEVMEIFRADRKLNISEAYLTPGFAFGGSCLPKDLRALVHAARHADVRLPILEAVLPSNRQHLERTVDAIVALGRRRVGMFGLAFKPGTDDLRESPLVELAERLLGKGFDLKIHDPAVALSNLVGSNREYIEEHIPHLATLLVERAEDVVAHADVCVVASRQPAVVEALARDRDVVVIDLVRFPDASRRRGAPGYDGVAW